MTKKEYIKQLRQFKSDASAFSTNITCAGGSDLMSKIARAQNLALWELIKLTGQLLDEGVEEEKTLKKVQRIVTAELEFMSNMSEDEKLASKEEVEAILKKILYKSTTATHVHVLKVQDFIHE